MCSIKPGSDKICEIGTSALMFFFNCLQIIIASLKSEIYLETINLLE